MLYVWTWRGTVLFRGNDMAKKYPNREESCELPCSGQGRIQDFWHRGSDLLRGVWFDQFTQFVLNFSMKIKESGQMGGGGGFLLNAPNPLWICHCQIAKSSSHRKFEPSMGSQVILTVIKREKKWEIKVSHVMRKPVYAICEQQRRRSACTSAQYDQHVVRYLDNIIPLVSIPEISSLYLDSVAAQAGLSLP